VNHILPTLKPAIEGQLAKGPVIFPIGGKNRLQTSIVVLSADETTVCPSHFHGKSLFFLTGVMLRHLIG
jgi:hypothetical protein